MQYLLLIPLLFIGCCDMPDRTVASCKTEGYKGIVSYNKLPSQSCSNGDRVGDCYLTKDGNMCNIIGRYETSVIYIEFKE